MKIISKLKQYIEQYIEKLVNGEDYLSDFNRNYSKYDKYYRKPNIK